MAYVKLNHAKLRDLMAKTGTNPADLARSLGLSRQLVSYILHAGGRKHITRLAKYFDCKESDLSVYSTSRVKLPQDFEIVNNKVRKTR